jgi:peptidoglycan/LPS O-acetylase OafA/YrhL
MKSKDRLYLPGLNGIRAVAALSVLFGHMWAPFGDWGIGEPAFWIPWPCAPVTTFFVISGFLITYLLMNEVGRMDDVSIWKFYMRRILRIWPLYYGYIVLALIAVAAFKGEINGAAWFYTFFAGNISHAIGIGIIPLYHFWSLGVEEQFYAWYPWMVKYNKKHILYAVCGLCALWFGLKLGSYVVIGKGLVYRIFAVTQFDCMMIGAAGAIMYYRCTEWLGSVCGNRYVAILSWVLFFTSGLWTKYVPSPITNEVVALISLLVIMSGLVRKPLLENSVMNYLGKISYGIYVIHPILIYTGTRLLGNVLSRYEGTQIQGGVCFALIFVAITGLTIGLASLSYKYFEMPFLRMKDKYSIVRSTNEMNSEK